MNLGRQLGRRGVPLTTALAAVALFAVGGDPLPESAAAAPAQRGYRILLMSNRDGATRGYSVRLDGTALTPLLRRGSTLLPAAASADGRTIAWTDQRRRAHDPGIYLSRADGTGLHRVVREGAGPLLSRDGRLLVFSAKPPGLWIVGADGRGRRRVTRGDDGPAAWSPDARSL